MASKVKAHIKDARLALRDLMQEQLAIISADLNRQIMAAYRKLPPSQQINAYKGLTLTGIGNYKALLKTALSVIALEAINMARKEVPKAKNTKLAESLDSITLAEFDRLPPDVQKKVQSRSQLIVDTQSADLEKATYFQFTSSVDSTDSESTLAGDLNDSSEDYITGASIETGATTIAAQVVNEARSAFFFTDDVLEEIDAFQFLNGDPVSPICQDLDGTIFPKDDPDSDRYMPPLHFNCKSYIVPILSGNLGRREITSLKPSQASLEKYIQLAEGVSCCGLAHNH